jgi:hypothetical protein
MLIAVMREAVEATACQPSFLFSANRPETIKHADP